MSDTANSMTATLLIEIPKRFKNIRVWRNNRVDAIVPGRGGRMRRVSAGIDGQFDVCGIIGPMGRMLQIEVKAGRDRMRDSQTAFLVMAEGLGAACLICRDVDVCLSELEVLYRGEGN